MDTRKIIQALAYLAYKSPGHILDNMKAYKLLWLADRYHLRQYGRTVTGDEYHALPHGVVPSDAKCLLERQATKLQNPTGAFDEYIQTLPNHCYKAVKPAYDGVFSETDMRALDIVWEKFGSLSPLELSELSHQFPEWKHYENDLNDQSRKNGYKIDMNLFFENKQEESGLFDDDPELLRLTKEVFREYRNQ